MVETVVTVERTTTTQSSSPTTGGGFSAIRLNVGYFRTVPGILKLVQFFLGILCLACASRRYDVFATEFFLSVAIPAFLFTILWISAYLLSIREAINLAINWKLTELLNTAAAAFFYFVAFIVQLATWSAYVGSYGYSRNIAAGVFGLFNFLAYAAGTYFLYLEHKGGATI